MGRVPFYNSLLQISNLSVVLSQLFLCLHAQLCWNALRPLLEPFFRARHLRRRERGHVHVLEWFLSALRVRDVLELEVPRSSSSSRACVAAAACYVFVYETGLSVAGKRGMAANSKEALKLVSAFCYLEKEKATPAESLPYPNPQVQHSSLAGTSYN